jgi:resuscitation-promoting factor RpfA
VNRETSDISSLYRQFGGDPGHYREIGRSNRAGVARERWPLLSQVQPGTRYVPPKVGSSTADRPVVAASWPPLAVPATLDLPLPDHASVGPVRAGAVASAEAVAALIHSAQVERQALDALTVPLVIEEDATVSEDPVGDIEFAPAVPAATPAVDTPVAEAYVATVPEVPPAPLPRMQERVEPHLQPRPQPIQAAANDAAPVAPPERIAVATTAATTTATTVESAPPPAAAPTPAPAAAKPAATTPTTSLQGIFNRLAQAPRSDAHPEQDSPPRKTTQK